ncbi:MAG: sigma-54-dependent transcriptional regulator, partial [Bullifex sp.]
MIKTVLFSANTHHRTTVNKITGQQCLFIRSMDNMAEAISDIPEQKLCIIDIDSPENYGSLFMQAMSLKESKVILLCPKTLMQDRVSMKIHDSVSLLRKPFTDVELSSLLPEQLNASKTGTVEDVFDTLYKGISENTLEVRNKARLFAANDDSVLIYGETGTGKEIISKAIARTYNGLKERVVVNCSQMNSDLCESALFGADKGSYTGSVSAIKGYAEEANGTSLILDEIENLSRSAQSMLLRFIEDRKYRPLGYYGNIMRQSDTKIILISNRSPKKLMEEGSLRNDLYHRICGQVIRIRPLRERKEDIPLLIGFHE